MTTNASDDPEMECDGEKIVTMIDVLQEQQEFEEDANAVLGASDEKNCTYTKGYIKRQALYACLTCCSEAKIDPTKRAGVCLACSLTCHENHELIELYTKRNFRCDCGNPKFNSHPCQFTFNKSDLNEENKYNQNFSGVYCICHRPYPDPESTVEDEMIQCIICEDWLHASHLEATVPPNDQYSEMICKACMENNEFLHDYSDLVVNTENVEVDVTTIKNTGTDGNDTVSNGDVNCDKLVNGVTEDQSKASNEAEAKDTDVDMAEITLEKESEVSTADVQQNSETNELSSKEESSEEQKKETDISMATEKSEKTAEMVPSDTGPDCTQNNIITSGESNAELKIDKQNKAEIIETNNDENETQMSNNDESCETLDNVENKQDDKLDNKDTNNEPENPVTDSATPDLASDDKIGENGEDQISRSDEIENMDDTQATEQINNKKSIDSEKFKNQSSEEISEIQPAEEKSELHPTEESNKEDITTKIDDTSQETEQNVGSGDKESNADSAVEASESSKDNMSQEMIASEENMEPDTMSDLIKTDDESKENQSTESDNSKANVSLESEKDETKTESTPEVKQTENTEETIAENTKENGNDADKNDGSHDIEMNDDTIDNQPSIENTVNETELSITGENTKENKRKLSTEAVDETVVKKPKVDAKPCSRPKGVKKTFKGATFWPSVFRQKLCTCNECINMYKDLSVLFLIDPDDTVSAYENLGKEMLNGAPVSQYEKGLEALSSLDRVQQINALTEYNKMRDKLIDFLKTFKDRKEVVKEEDVKAFFAGMKPKREPDGVYFCR